MQNVLSSRVLQGFSDLVSSYGYDADEIAELVGLDKKALHQPDLLIASASFNDMLEEAALICQQRFFGLKLADLQGWDILGPVWQLIRTAGTVGEALQLLASHLELHSDALCAHLIEDDLGASFSFEVRRVGTPQRTGRVQVVELGLAICCKELRGMLGDGWRPGYAQFRHAGPANQSALVQVFGGELNFNQDVDAIHLSKEDLEQRLETNHLTMKEDLESATVRDIPFVLKVDRVIRRLVNGDGCSAEAAAQASGIKLRTMQYRLKQHNTSYQLLYDKARLDLARHYLVRSGLSIAAIAERLHFVDSAVFSRFVKKGTGESPKAFRDANQDR